MARVAEAEADAARQQMAARAAMQGFINPN
jgi:hypothetical protein